MKRLLVVIAIAGLAACTQNDENRAKTKVKEAGRELKQDARRVSEEVKQGVKEADQKAGPKLHKAGEELKQDAAHASQKLKEESQKLDQKLHDQ